MTTATKPHTYGPADLEELYTGATRRATVRAHFVTTYTGGQPGGAPEVEQFVLHHLSKTDTGLREIDPEKPETRTGKPNYRLTESGRACVARIMQEEVGERVTTPAGGEVAERESYGVNVIRQCPACGGKYIGNWQIKACLKSALSKLGYFMDPKKRGSKGDVAEFGRVTDLAPQRESGCSPYHVHLLAQDGEGLAPTSYDRLMGSVQTPSGRKSICQDAEVAPPGTRFAFELRVPRGKLTEEDLAKAIAFTRNIGLGSGKALERGKFEVDELEIQA